MIIYLDLVYIVNCISDAVSLYLTARLSSFPVSRKRILVASLLGGVYGVLSYMLPHDMRLIFLLQLLFAMFMVGIVFGHHRFFLRLFSLFILLSFTLGGLMTVVLRYIQTCGNADLIRINDWKVFFLVGGLTYVFLSVVFRGSVRHRVSGQVLRTSVTLDNICISLNALHDTGHMLCDPFSDSPVLTSSTDALKPFFKKKEQKILQRLGSEGAIHCAEELGKIVPGKFRLLPYRAVGIEHSMLLVFQADKITVDGKDMGSLPVALSPTPLCVGEGYAALWGGERRIVE